ncbi:MAG: CoA-binding protein [Methanomicrobiales archaeon HGW-Methanomicrobiales-3]|jgi:acetyl coenzyme A synthetase (ADP forming)-like protein|nr:MAG: CoA-binding protein [Methanomicrobiales archaeon HGW-Methanomicrobiales-3]
MTKKLISEAEGYELLTSAGLPVPKHAIARSADEAAAIAATIGYPVVLKIVSPQVVHKSDAGGVVTNLTSADEVKQAYDTILANVRSFSPEAVIEGIIVIEQLKKGLEILIGGRVDSTFGKIITVGMGGTLVELIRDVSIRVLPVERDDIEAMLAELRGSRLIEGYRNEPARDRETLITLIEAITRFFVARNDIVEFDINPVFLYEKGACVVDARFYRDPDRTATVIAPARPLPAQLLRVNSIAVIGASPEPSKVGYAILRNLLSFPGKVYPVNPKHQKILGRDVYPTLAAIPDPVDIAVIVLPAKRVPGVMRECGERGVPLVVIISSGFRESGKEGALLEAELLVLSEQYGTRIIGPNCLGLMLPNQTINTTFDPVSPKPGRIAFISQSGAIITTIVDWSLPEEIGFSAIISVGNQADLSFEDFCLFAGDDPTTRAIILYVEEIRDGQRFMEIVRKVTDKKPIVAVKSGASRIGRMAAASHTGSLAGSHEVYMAAFWQAGVIPARSIREAFQTAQLLSSEGYPKGIRAIVITNAGGFGVLASDYAERYGIEMVEFPEPILKELDAVLPVDWNRRNPIDMVGDASADRFARTFDIMIKNQDLWDIAFVIAVPSAISDPIRVSNEVVRFSKSTHKMMVGCMIGGDSMKTPLRILRDADIPNFPELEDAFRSVGNVCRHLCWQEYRGSSCVPNGRHDQD